jgi:glycosyltransferase involved in cell wall biosynthesis
VLSQLGLQGTPYILAVARLVPEKGLHDLIAAFRALVTDKVLVIAGAADHETDYSRAILRSAGQDIRFLGSQSRPVLRRLYEGAALFVLPSLHEGLPIAALEAVWCGTPILLSDISANRDIGLPDDNYFAAGDVKALTAALGEVDSARFEVDRDLVNRRFDWTKIARETAQVYADLIGPSVETH